MLSEMRYLMLLLSCFPKSKSTIEKLKSTFHLLFPALGCSFVLFWSIACSEVAELFDASPTHVLINHYRSRYKVSVVTEAVVVSEAENIL
jgi:hypothetical protein